MQIRMTYNKTGRTGEYEISRKRIVLKKIVALAVLAVLALVSVKVFSHYSYLLDSYYYSAEFHVNFMKNNLRSANTELLVDYFKSLETIPKILPLLLFAHIVQNFWVVFSDPVLVAAITSVAGLPQSTALNYASLLLTGLIAFGLGVFFLGDILPVFLKKQDVHDLSVSKKYAACGIAGILFSVPLMPVVIPAFLSALFRIRVKPVLIIMIAGFTIRILLLISLPDIFI